MKEENRILELLSEVLHKQDRMQSDLDGLKQDVSSLKQDVSSLKQDVSSLKQDMQEVKLRLGQVEENQQAHQKILRTLVVAQQNNQQVLERIFDLLDTVTRMQRDHGRRLDRLENPDGPGIAA